MYTSATFGVDVRNREGTGTVGRQRTFCAGGRFPVIGYLVWFLRSMIQLHKISPHKQAEGGPVV